jgi:hypothetical protein
MCTSHLQAIASKKHPPGNQSINQSVHLYCCTDIHTYTHTHLIVDLEPLAVRGLAVLLAVVVAVAVVVVAALLAEVQASGKIATAISALWFQGTVFCAKKRNKLGKISDKND